MSVYSINLLDSRFETYLNKYVFINPVYNIFSSNNNL